MPGGRALLPTGDCVYGYRHMGDQWFTLAQERKFAVSWLKIMSVFVGQDLDDRAGREGFLAQIDRTIRQLANRVHRHSAAAADRTIDPQLFGGGLALAACPVLAYFDALRPQEQVKPSRFSPTAAVVAALLLSGFGLADDGIRSRRRLYGETRRFGMEDENVPFAEIGERLRLHVAAGPA